MSTMSHHELQSGQLALMLQLLTDIRDGIVKGENWEGSASYREVEVGATVSEVASATTDTRLARGNRFRRQIIIYNDSSAVLYVKYGNAGEGATTTDYSIQIPAGGGLVEDKYAGPIHGVWASANGFARVTEF